MSVIRISCKFSTALVFASSLLLASSARTQTIDSSAAPPGAVLAAWSQITGMADTDPKVLAPQVAARFVVQGAEQDCSRFEMRAIPASSPAKATPEPRANPDIAAFPVTVCQSILPVAWANATIADAGSGDALTLWQPGDGRGASTGPPIELRGPYSIGRKHAGRITMVSLGDTGCRADGKQPHCALNAADWPFNRVAMAAAEADPDFVIHVGDYRYYDEGHTPDTWKYWYEDFFRAAQPLLLNAPWAFSRGNHEQCHNSWAPYWYGMGWFYLLESRPTIGTTLCFAGKQTVQVPAWRFDVAVKGETVSAPHRFVMLDTGPNLPTDSAAAERFLDQMSGNFTTAIDASRDVRSSWWVTHRPPVSLAYYRGAWHYADDNVRKALLDAIPGGDPGGLCSELDGRGAGCMPALVLAGHLHIYQSVEFSKNAPAQGWAWPKQVITGNGGVVDVEGLNFSPCTYDDFPMAAAKVGTVTWNTSHGYILWTRTATTAARDPAGWTQQPVFIGDAPVPAAGPAPCGPASSPP